MKEQNVIRTTFLTPALVGQNEVNWNVKTPICRAVRFMKDRVIVRGKSVQRGKA